MSDTVRSSSHWGAFRAVTRDGRFVEALPFEHDSDPTPLLRSMPSAVHAETRIQSPMVRRGWLDHGPGDTNRRRGGEPFVAVSWDEALDLVAGELARVKDSHGNRAIFGGSYGWSSAGRVNHARTLVHRFLNGFGGHVGQVTNYSWGTAATLLPHLVGGIETTSGPVSDWSGIVANTRLMVLFGGVGLKNGRVTSGGAGSHDYRPWLEKARAAGIEFVNVSPLRSDAPDFLEARWLPIRPNSDVAMMLAMAHTLAEEGLADRAFLDRCTTGYDRFRAYLMGETDGQPKTPEWAAAITEIDAGTIRALARQMASCRTMLTATWSLQRAEHGEQPFWGLIALAAMLGQIGLPGGGFGFGYGSINGMGSPRPAIATPNMEEGPNPVGFSIPVARIADLLLEPGRTIDYNGRKLTFPDIKLVYWAGGNPFHHHQDLNRLQRAWHRPETIIVHEPWWTATARLADIVLPATTPWERDDLGSAPRDRFILAMRKIVEPQHEARNDYDIFAALAERLGFREAFTEGRDITGWIRRLYDVARDKAAAKDVALPDFDTFWREGYVETVPPAAPFVQFSEFRADPAARPLRTRSGKIEIFCEEIAELGLADCPGHPAWLPPREWLGAPAARDFPLHLLSNQPPTRLHSQMDDGLVSRYSKVAGREPITISTRDASARGIRNGDVVRVYNHRGACLAGAIVADTIRPGVVQLATGAWLDPAEPGTPGSLDKHGNPNVLTQDVGTSRLGQGSSAQSALVEIERWVGEAPEMTAFIPPRMEAR